MIEFDLDDYPEIPKEIAVCPICGESVIIEDIDEWEISGKVTEHGFHINCSTEPDIDSDEWEEWFNVHWSTPYIDWLPLQEKIYQWFIKNYKLKRPWGERVDIAGGE